MNIIRWPIVGLLLASLSVLANPTDSVFSPDHYLSYDISTIALRKHHIQLKDQFIDWSDFTVRKPIKLLNPTVKRHNNEVYGIKDPLLHYAAYELEDGTDININENVLVINQFGSFKIDSFRPELLLAPTRKANLTPFSDSIDGGLHHNDLYDHYLCYEIPPIEIDDQDGFLKDQFRSREFGRLVARRLCNPAAKIHDSKLSDIAHDTPENHLMCFEIEQKRIFKIVGLHNQFGYKKALVTKDEELCVPSVKIKLNDDCVGQKPDEDGTCNGLCPDPDETCVPDSTTDKCSCIKDTKSCWDSWAGDDGVCNGLCPAGEICVATQDQRCECRHEFFPCGVQADGTCGGLCPIDTPFCDFIPGTNACGCTQ